MDSSQPWQLGAWDLQEDLAKIEQQLASIEEILHDAAQFERRNPEISDWSCGQQAGHAIMVAQTIADRIYDCLAEPNRHRDEVAPELALRVLSAGDFPRGSVTSPPEVHPESRPREDFVALLPAAIEAWRGIQARADEIQACAARFPHFRLGYLTSSEWVRFCAVHTAHHLALIRDIAAAAPGVAGPSRDPR